MDSIDAIIKQLSTARMRRRKMISALCVLSFAVALGVFWQLRIIGITMTDEAGCGLVEHTHNDSCNACGLQEHTHTLQCYADPHADVETQAQWEATLPQLLNDNAADLVRVAKSQLGYTESTRNIVLDSNEYGVASYSGYTRYGAWYGTAKQFTHIDNWSAMFASFCLHYAQIDEVAALQNHGCNTMLRQWQGCGSFRSADEYSPMFGDLVFLSKDGNANADSIGIISRVSQNGFSAIEGSCDGRVKENSYSFADESILGYGVLPKSQPAQGASAAELTSGESSFAQVPTRRMAARGLRSGSTNEINLDIYISDIDDDGEAISASYVVLNPDSGDFDLSLRIEFSMPLSVAVDSLSTATGSFRYDLPGILNLSNQLISGSPYAATRVGDASTHAFDYWFKVDPNVPEGEDGHYYIEIKYDESYLTGTSADVQITNYINFNCSLSGDTEFEQDGMEIFFAGGFELEIPPSEIIERYDVTTSKTGSYGSANGDKLSYTVVVSSTDGTPGIIELSDKVTYTEQSGLSSIGSPSLVSVQKLPSNTTVTADCTFTPQVADPTAFDMTLPQLSAGESYRITYEYSISNLPENAQFTANNEVSAQTESQLHLYNDTSVYTIRKGTQPKASKSGALTSDGSIVWTILVNQIQGNIAGELVTDDMFSQITPADITVQNGNNQWNPTPAGANEYTIVYNQTTGEVTGIQFNGAADGSTNNNAYLITYTTPSDVEFGETKVVQNTVTFDDESVTASVWVSGGTVQKSVNDFSNPSEGEPGTVTWRVGVNIPGGGIEAGTAFEDVFGVVGDASSDAHYMTAQQYNDLALALQAQSWWSNMTGLEYTTDGTTFVSAAPTGSERIIGYRFSVASAAAGSALADQSLSWTYTTTASMESSGGSVTVPEYNPAVYYYPAGTIVQWNGWLYQATHGGAAQNEPSLNYTLTEGDLSKPWLRIGSAGGSDAYRSFSNTLRVGEKEIVVKKSFSSRVHKYSVRLGANGDYSLSDESTDLYFNETTQDKTLRWLVEVDAGTADTFILTDALPEQVQLVGLYVASAQRMQWELTPYQSEVDFTSDGSAFTDSVQGYTVTGSYDADGDNEVNLSITPAAGGKFRVLFVCELKENYLPQNGQRFIYSLGNSAEVQVNDEIFGEAENTINLTVEERKTVTEKTGTRNYKKNPDGSLMLDNSGNPIWDNTITYTVDINPNAENLVINPLLDPNDTLFIKDTLSYVCRDEIGTGSATLGLGSISLIDANTNEPVSVEWTARTTVLNNIRTSTIEGRVPDGRHLILSYTYSIWSTMQSGISLHNTVTIEGSAFQPGEFDEIHGKEDFQTHAGSDYPEYHIIKVAKVGREPLAGARFTAYAWVYDVVSGGYNWVAVDKTYVSDGNGVIKISAFDKADSSPQNNVYSVNTAYCVMETAAPPGYIIDPNNIPTYYFWVSANNSTAPANAPADFMAYALDLTFSSGQEYVENEMGNDYTLPETGSPGALLCTAGGAVLMAFALIYGYTSKRKRERRLIVPP